MFFLFLEKKVKYYEYELVLLVVLVVVVLLYSFARFLVFYLERHG